MLRAQYRHCSCSCTAAVSARSRVRHRRCTRRSHRLPVVATSEFWWEDEQEFDALTEVLQPKQVFITTPTAAAAHMQQLKASTRFAAAFTAPTLKAEAEQVWEQLGREGPPLFLKVRVRDCLQEQEQDPPTSNSTAAEQFWAEVTSQTWRTELDHGLAGGQDTTAATAAVEQILVVVSSSNNMRRLVHAAVAAAAVDDTSDLTSSSSSSIKDQEGVVVVEFDGWNQGQTQQQLTSWKHQLRPRIQQLMQG